MKYSPIVLFTYNRPLHTKKTVEALQKNKLSNQSDLFIFSDAAKNDKERTEVQEVRDYLQSISGFKSIKVIERTENFGLAKSIVEGVTSIINLYGRAIILEDDIVTSPSFLLFMNNALEKYADESRVWHISGWNYPIETDELDDVFFWRVMNCWGWGTWSNKWKSFEKNSHNLDLSFSKKQKYLFDLDGSGIFWSQVKGNLTGEINTWAIFWYATIFKHEGLCLNPSKSFVENIGHDGSGIHCGKSKNNNKNLVLNTNKSILFSNQITESKLAVRRIKKFYINQKRFKFIHILKKHLLHFKYR